MRQALRQAWPEAGIWLALMALLATTFAAAFIPMGAFNSFANLLIAAFKASLVGLFFMHLYRSSAIMRLAAAAGLFWLLILFGLTFSDFLTRP
jgi:cytochrome c oxidase subunit 4